MYIPEGMTEEQVLEAIEIVVNRVAPTFKFGYYGIDDIKQEARILALDCLDRYRPSMNKPLTNFLYSHVRNRLINFRRDNYIRNDPPCFECHYNRTHKKTKKCHYYQLWLNRNSSKQNIMNPLNLDNISDEHEHNTMDNSSTEENVMSSCRYIYGSITYK